MKRVSLLLVFGVVWSLNCCWASAQDAVPVGTAMKIWDQAPHNAFTDLVRFNDRWFCVFREGQGHVSPDGALRVITSVDGETWESAALITSGNSDLRDAKITVTPDGQLMLCGAEALHDKSQHTHQSLAWFSKDGRTWSEKHAIGDPDFWLWRVTWHKGTAYGIGYGCGKEKSVRLYSSKDGKKFETLVEHLHDVGYPNETSIVFDGDTAYSLLRRDGQANEPNTGLLGVSQAPFTKWAWKDLGTRIGGPHMTRLPDGRFLAAVRLYDNRQRTSLCWLDPQAGKLTEFHTLPSGGDTSYAGLVRHEEKVWISYYSSHEGKTSIYLSTIPVPVRAASEGDRQSGQAKPDWEMTKTVATGDLDVSLSKPRLVARSSGYLWFPTMTRLSGGELFANFSTNLDAVVADRTSSVSWSADDGLTWSEPSSIAPKGDLYAETMLRLKNGDEMLLPFNLYPDGEAMRGWHQIVSGRKGRRNVTFTDKSLTVSGWPRPDRSFNEQLGLSGFGFNGHGLTGKSGEYLATMYGYFKDERRYSLVMVESSDGLAWKFRSLIAGFDCPLAGGEGPCESQTIRLKDGRLMNVFRLASSVPYGQTFSDDDGRTWSAPVAMKETHSVQPSMAVMKDGTLVLTGGRPGVFAWINKSGDGGDWLQVDLLVNHNEKYSEESINVGGSFTLTEQTTSYTEVVPLDEKSVLVMYDRIPHGWSAIPGDSQDTNSIWVVKLAWDRH